MDVLLYCFGIFFVGFVAPIAITEWRDKRDPSRVFHRKRHERWMEEQDSY